MKKIFIMLALATITIPSVAQNERMESVMNSSRKVNNHFMEKYADPTIPTNVGKVRPSNLWTRAVYYEGLFNLYGIDKDQRYIDYTDKWADFHRWMPRNGVTTTDADDQCCGQAYIERFFQTGDSSKIKGIRENIDLQMKSGRVDYWTWIDAIQMCMPVYAELYKVTGNRAYMDYGMKMYNWSRNECGGGLYNKKNGFWWRDKDYVPPYKETDGNDCYWSRGNGWVYAALVRVMNQLDRKDKYYKALKGDFVKMSKAFASCQRSDGFWNVSLVSPVTYGGKEVTGTALFLYGMSWGIINGILPASKYKDICDRAWDALEKDAIHEDGVLGYVQGTGKDPSAGQPVTYDKTPDFEDYGTGCFLLGSTEYYKLLKKLYK
jgi:rhamnogalacturonyl hydrolase YesR